MERRRTELPPELGSVFSVADAARNGVTRSRLRGADLERPFHGVRVIQQPEDPASDPSDHQRQRVLALARAYAERMRASEFFSHETAALIWGAPLPSTGDGPIHVTVRKPAAAPRASGVAGHVMRADMVTMTTVGGLRVSSPASTWAMLGGLAVFDLVALGDFFVREWRAEGYFRVNVGRPPLTTVTQLQVAMDAGRRAGAARLREALPLIRQDSWSRPESLTRCHLIAAGLPEPTLNQDYYDRDGIHLGCIDLSYPGFKIAIEYQGRQHSARYGRDIERIERLRAHGWIVIQVTSTLLFQSPDELVRRVRNALISRGWRA